MKYFLDHTFALCFDCALSIDLLELNYCKIFALCGMMLLIPGISYPAHSAEFSAVSQVESGTPVSVLLSCYSTTLRANGADRCRVRLAVADSSGREITASTDTIRIYVSGKGTIADAGGTVLALKPDAEGKDFAECQLSQGTCQLLFIAGTEPDKVKVEAKSGTLWAGAHEIHTIPADVALLQPKPAQLPPTVKKIDRMIGADISFLPQNESRGRKFIENGEAHDAVTLLRNHGFNYIRLRIFVNPELEKGYAPNDGYCDLTHTLAMAKRIDAAGMKLLLDFHYSDYWADPQQQNKPHAWKDLEYAALRDVLKKYTSETLKAFAAQGTLPAMVQLGNEINHGLLWPDGHIGNLDGLAGLLQAGVEGVEAVDANLPVMMHIALGGQNDEAVFWLDNMLARGVRFDIIGLSYYPRYHGTLDDLKSNLEDLAQRYHKPLNVVEYSDYKREVHQIVFGLPDGMGKGACIWEPLGGRGGFFDRNGVATGQLKVYDELKAKYLAAPE